MKLFFSILGIIVCFSFTSCKKEDKQSATPNPSPPPITDYRDKYLGVYQGPYISWVSSMGVTNQIILDSAYSDVISKDSNKDSVIISEHFGPFTLSPQGTATAVVTVYAVKTLQLKNDSLKYLFTNISLGGQYGNIFDGKKQ